VIGHAHDVADDRVGDRDRASAGRRAAEAMKVHADRIAQAGVIGTRQHDDVIDRRAGSALPGEARIGAADVGQQPCASIAVDAAAHGCTRYWRYRAMPS
jgi:hypothetical protein